MSQVPASMHSVTSNIKRNSKTNGNQVKEHDIMLSNHLLAKISEIIFVQCKELINKGDQFNQETYELKKSLNEYIKSRNFRENDLLNYYVCNEYNNFLLYNNNSTKGYDKKEFTTDDGEMANEDQKKYQDYVRYKSKLNSFQTFESETGDLRIMKIDEGKQERFLNSKELIHPCLPFQSLPPSVVKDIITICEKVILTSQNMSSIDLLNIVNELQRKIDENKGNNQCKSKFKKENLNYTNIGKPSIGDIGLDKEPQGDYCENNTDSLEIFRLQKQLQQLQNRVTEAQKSTMILKKYQNKLEEEIDRLSKV